MLSRRSIFSAVLRVPDVQEGRDFSGPRHEHVDDGGSPAESGARLIRMRGYRIRQAAVADVAVIARHRVRMFEEMGELEPGDAPAVESATRARLAVELVSGQYVAWPRASLHASSAGRAVYERLGFAPSNEMRVSTAPSVARM
jgi:hypothetical protein